MKDCSKYAINIQWHATVEKSGSSHCMSQSQFKDKYFSENFGVQFSSNNSMAEGEKSKGEPVVEENKNAQALIKVKPFWGIWAASSITFIKPEL